jgi:uncharacterized protein YbaR (Trm112 family)/ubiquinone/menaquinone biosynthesis C-methylase UbiE
VKRRLLEILACPNCRSDLGIDIFKEDKEIREGELICKKCDSVYPVKDYIPRFVKSDEYVNTFSFEWYKHKTTQLDSKTGLNESEETFKRKTCFDLDKMKGKLILDAGCGVGRFMEVALKYGAEVVGVDLSFAVDITQENVGANKKAHIIQADIFNLPFKERVFDYIFSIGVLHHTPNTKEAFFSLVPFVKKGGEMAIWVYSDEGAYMKLYNRASNFWRFFTTKIPPEKLYAFCKIYANLMYPLKRIRYLRIILQIILPPSNYHHNRMWRILDTYDWLSPKYQWKHTYKEVERWFKEAGFEKIERLKVSVAVKGRID